MTDTRVTPQRWLWQPRQKSIRMIEIHATRGATTPAKQKGAALNWVQSPRNVGNRKADGTPDYDNPEWGGSHSHVIGTDGSEGTVLDDNQMPTYSAGYGGAGSTYAIDEYAISYELAQSPAQEPFSDAIYDRLTKEVAADCKRYGIPPVMIEIPRQVGEVPTGIVRHDKCENGIKLGKTDPGDQFDEARFIGMVIAKMEDEMTPEQEQQLKDTSALLNIVQGQTNQLLEANKSFLIVQGQVNQLIKQHKDGHSSGGVDSAEVRRIAREEDDKLRVTK